MALVRWLLIAVTAVVGLSLWTGGQCDADAAAPPVAHQAPQTTHRQADVIPMTRAAPDASARSHAHDSARAVDCCPLVALTAAKAVRADVPQLAPADSVVPHWASPPGPASLNRHSVRPAISVTLTQIGVSRT
jgi:hypothetical protein